MLKDYNLKRLPATKNKSLQAWSAIDELLLHESQSLNLDSVCIINDAFGALTCALSITKPIVLVDRKSQLKAISQNLKLNELEKEGIVFSNLLKVPHNKFPSVFLRIPKSLDLFQLYLHQIHSSLTDKSTVLCGFMTRNFTPNLLEIAHQYFETVEQTKAHKRARLLKLSKPKSSLPDFKLFKSVNNDLDLSLKQYAGVFSSGKIDNATRMLLQSLPQIEEDSNVLDVACGNGVIGTYVRKQQPKCTIDSLDDSYLAIASAKLNLPKSVGDFYWSNSIQSIKDKQYDYILCNPPFHFEHENTIEIALQLFKETKSILKEEGAFYVVSNKHLNYTTHLSKLYPFVSQVAETDKFEVLKCAL
jgi:23S rRNA (guanine1835-N2)-methyltransferase